MVDGSTGSTAAVADTPLAKATPAQDPSPTDESAPVYSAEQIEFFEKRIRPVLAEHCDSCHSSGAKQVRGGLLLDSREAARKGGDTGPAVVPGKPELSLLLQAIRHDGLEMPPSQKLPQNIVADFTEWIVSGAADPRTGTPLQTEKSVDIEEGRKFWCFQPIVRHPVPAVHSEWPLNDIDCWIAAGHERNSVMPAADLPPERLLRRLHYVLSGLIPRPDESRAFVRAWAENPEAAVAGEVDRLLQSPRFGERWGRHWLDVTRYAESSGGGRSLMFPDAWRFRDYVIRSVNEDKPFDQLLREHIAGDLLSFTSDAQRDDQRTGAGYLILGAINYEEQDKEALRMDVVDEQIDTLGRTFLGMTLGCARCHDHKFDPVPTDDYYALAGVFRSTRSLTPGNVSGYVRAPLAVAETDQAAFKAWTEQEKILSGAVAALRAGTAAAQKEEKGQPEAAKQLREAEASLKKHLAAKPEPPHVMCVEDEKEPSDWHIHIRGGIRNRGPVVARGFLRVATAVGTAPPKIPPGTSGRLQLAEWMTASDQPLVSRVFVNRVWMHLIGEGLVRTPDNFGSTGERPTHPELLDYLAFSFMSDDHWSLKQLVRRICLSRTFRLNSEADEAAYNGDPENRQLTRGFRRRQDAESLRDNLLMISGELDLNFAGGRTIGKMMEYDVVYDHNQYPLKYRSVYIPFFRNAMLDLFYVFDVANPNMVTGRRTEGTLPSQSLFMMNSPFVVSQAALAAQRFLADDPDTDPSDAASSDRTVSADTVSETHSVTNAKYADTERRISKAWQIVLGREPTAEERQLVIDRLSATDVVESEMWGEIFHSLFSSVDFRFVD